MISPNLQAQVEAALSQLEHVPYCRQGNWILHPGQSFAEASPTWQIQPPGTGWVAVTANGPGAAMECINQQAFVLHDAWHCTCAACGKVFAMDEALGTDLSTAVRKALMIQ